MCIVGAVGHDFYTGERNGPKGFPRFTDPALRDASGYARLPAHGDRAQPGAVRDRRVRPAAAPQPRPHRLHERDGLERDGGAARSRPDPPDRRRARAGQRVHARPDRLPRAVRRADRLGDDHPEPARALARRAVPRRGGERPGEGDHARRRLRGPVLRRRAARPGAASARSPQLPSGGMDRGRVASGSTRCGRSQSATG